MSSFLKRRNGFQGERMISLPQKLWKDALVKDPELFQLYITHIGYFPKASAHYRERRKGCEDNILIYCLHGKGHFVIKDKRFEVVANQFISIPATDVYMRYWADEADPWTIYWVHYRGNKIDDFNRSLNLNISRGPQQIPFNQKAIDIWESIYQSLEMGYSKENLCNASFCLYHFLATFCFTDKHIIAEKNDPVNIITEAILYMKSNLERKLSVGDIAAQHFLSSSHFSSLFRKNTGMSPIDYFIHLKMQRACQLLYSKDIKIKLVAIELGYEDQYYFSRIFKKNMGMSPEHYRSISKKGV